MQPKKIRCQYCGEQMAVSPRAFSVSCPKCYQRLTVEDYEVLDFQASNRMETCGSIRVGPKAELHSQLRARELEVQGELIGDVSAEEKVTIGAGGRLVGDIRAARMEVKSGASIEGFCRIEPPPPGA